MSGEAWKKPHRTFVAPSGAQFHTMTGLLTHYHRCLNRLSIVARNFLMLHTCVVFEGEDVNIS